MKTEFIYNSFSPVIKESCFLPPRRMPQKNKVTVWIEGGKIHFKRQYMSKNGKISDGIETVFEDNETVEEIAKMIHWGCSGTSKNVYQLHHLIEDIRPVVESLK